MRCLLRHNQANEEILRSGQAEQMEAMRTRLQDEHHKREAAAAAREAAELEQQRLKERLEFLESSLTCAICYEVFVSRRCLALRCGHIYCVECIQAVDAAPTLSVSRRWRAAALQH